MKRLQVTAHAKINLNLRVLGRFPDGYHDIDTILQTITLHDDLVFEEATGGISLRVADGILPADRSNLVHRAADLMFKEAGGGRGVHIELVKRIPMGAGLGGGSSDAAATLGAINRLLGLEVPPDRLVSLASSLGSDVPFFLIGGIARATGRGTRLEPLVDLEPFELLILYPGEAISTADVYAQLDEPLTPAAKIDSMTDFGRPSRSREVEYWMRAGNALEPHARALCPVITELQERLKLAGASSAAMTGSGSAVYGVFRDGALRDRAARDLKGNGWDIFPCAPMGRGEYRRTQGLE